MRVPTHKEKRDARAAANNGKNVNARKVKRAPAAAPKIRIRPPRNSVVSITVPPDRSVSCAKAMSEACRSINLNLFIGIEGGLRPKRGMTGSLLWEVPGAKGASRAEDLARELGRVLQPLGVKVSRPKKMVEVRVSGLEGSITPEDVTEALSSTGGCALGDVRVGSIRTSPNGLGTAWARCPAAVAKKATVAGRVLVGWAVARIEALPARPSSVTAVTSLVTWQRSALERRTGVVFATVAVAKATPPTSAYRSRGVPYARGSVGRRDTGLDRKPVSHPREWRRLLCSPLPLTQGGNKRRLSRGRGKKEVRPIVKKGEEAPIATPSGLRGSSTALARENV